MGRRAKLAPVSVDDAPPSALVAEDAPSDPSRGVEAGERQREVAAAMRFAFATLKLVVEPGGAVCLAALLAGRFEARGRVVGLTLSGGNVDPAVYARILAG